jgi:2-oxoglutarate ferredoxin oxidoreductase subunit beta
MIEMMERAARHDGFSVVEILSECVEFYPGAFDSAVPRKGGKFQVIEEKKNDGTPEDALKHDPSDVLAAYRLALLPWPGVFGVFYESQRPTKNALEAGLIAKAKAKNPGATDLELLQASFSKMR